MDMKSPLFTLLKTIKKKKEHENVAIVETSGQKHLSLMNQILLTQEDSSFIIVDPTGELYYHTKDHFKERGYAVKVLNPRNVKESTKYNPFAVVMDSNEDISTMAALLADSEDGFWRKMSEQMYMLLFEYMDVCFPGVKDRTFAVAYKLLNKYSADEFLEEAIVSEKTEALATILSNTDDKTKYAVYSACQFRLRDLAENEIFTADEMKLDCIGDEKTVIFLEAPLDELTYDVAMKLMLYQVHTLYQGGFNNSKYHITFIIDEMYRFTANYEKTLTKIFATESQYVNVIAATNRINDIFKEFPCRILYPPYRKSEKEDEVFRRAFSMTKDDWQKMKALKMDECAICDRDGHYTICELFPISK